MRAHTLLLTAAALLSSPLTAGLASEQVTLFSSVKPRRLIRTSEDSPPQWMSDHSVDVLREHRIRFMDITDDVDDDASLTPAFSAPIPSMLSAQKEVRSYLRTMNTALMKSFLAKFTQFRTRYYLSKSGRDSQVFLLQEVQRIAHSASEDRLAPTVRTFTHRWGQSSIIARFEGSVNPDQIVVVGAHQDSVNMWMPMYGRSPGADDDGSGTSTILEAFRTLVAGGFKPERTVEFHWYSGEEGGLLGSQAVASQYRREGRKVVAMLQNDMTGFLQDEEVIGVVTDYVDGELTAFLKLLIREYSGVGLRELHCGYACSDHASWNKYGYRSVFHFEADNLEANSNVHTVRDDYDTISFDHALRYAKISVGFAIELSRVNQEA